MKKLTLLAVLYFTGTAFAFSQSNSGNDVPKMLNNLKTTCQLTSQQMAKLQPIVGKHAIVLNTDKQKLTGTELTTADNAENARYEAQLKGILTPEQMNSYKNSQK
jgi:hypothetical protein